MTKEIITRYKIKREAKDILRGNLGICSLFILVYIVLSALFESITGVDSLFPFNFILNILVIQILSLMLTTFFVNSINRNEFSFINSKINFKMYIKNLAFTMLSSIMFIIPFIIMSYAFLEISSIKSIEILFIVLFVFFSILLIYVSLILYAVPYLIIESNGEIKFLHSIKESYKITKGNVTNLLILVLSFFGWIILSIFTFGIGFIWLIPYMYTTEYIYFKKLKENYYNNLDK